MARLSCCSQYKATLDQFSSDIVLGKVLVHWSTGIEVAVLHNFTFKMN